MSPGLLGNCHVGGTIQGWCIAHLNLFETEPKKKKRSDFHFFFHSFFESISIRIFSARLCESSIFKFNLSIPTGLREVRCHQICILDLLTASRPFRYLHDRVLSLTVSTGRQARALWSSLKSKHDKEEECQPRHASICWTQQRCAENAVAQLCTTLSQWWLIYHNSITYFHSSQPCVEKTQSQFTFFFIERKYKGYEIDTSYGTSTEIHRGISRVHWARAASKRQWLKQRLGNIG